MFLSDPAPIASFGEALLELIFGDTGQLTQYTGRKVPVFVTACAIMGLVAVGLDLILFFIRRRSFFELGYGAGSGAALRLVALWGLGAGLGGFFGAAAGIIQLNRLACISVAVAWPLILPRLIKSSSEGEDQQNPEVK